MASPHPAHLEAALAHLKQTLAAVGEGSLDLAQASWADVEKATIKVLRGAFAEANPEHQAVALGLAALFAERIMKGYSAFWFPNREAPEGAMVGFEEALIVLSPYAAVADALSRAQLQQLDQTQAQIRQAIGQVKFAPGASPAAPVRLTPVDYVRLFDPGFVQLVALDLEKARQAWDARPDRLIRDVREALGRVGQDLPAQAKNQLEAQLVGALGRLDPEKTLSAQGDVAVRLLELLGHLFGTTESTGAAPEEFWQEVVIPLLFIGAPEQFPPVEKEEIDAVKQGAAGLLDLWVEAVPYGSPAPEEGLMGAFDAAEIKVPLPQFAAGGVPRMLEVGTSSVRAPLTRFDPEKIRAAMKRFGEAVEKQAGKAPVLGPDAEQMLEASLTLLTDFQKLMGTLQPGKTALCVRRITEAEAASELTLSVLRKALFGPRLILTSR
jgi:hypothetical protein